MIESPTTLTARSLVRLLKTISTVHPTLPSAVQLHPFLLKSGHLTNPFITTSLLTLYSPSPLLARQLFDEMPQPSLIPFTAMARISSPLLSLRLFLSLLSSSISPDAVSFSIALSSSRRAAQFSAALSIHALITKSGTSVDAFLSTELIGLYGDLTDLSSVNLLLLETCSRTVAVYNAAIHQFIKNGDVDSGYELFTKMTERDVISWNTVVSGFSKAGRCMDALALFREMAGCGVVPNGLTFCTVLSACAGVGALGTGMWIHAWMKRKGVNFDRSLDHCVIDMYAKCGSIEKALQVFYECPVRKDLYSWTSVICGLAMHGQANDAVNMFDRMREVGVRPDDITLVGVLNACAHGGLVKRATELFSLIEEPKVEHYGCMVDLFGRMGRVKHAYELVKNMPMAPNAVIWGALLSACKVHNNVEIGEIAAMRLGELEPGDHWARVMMSNLYAEDCDWSGVTRVRKEMREEGTTKMPGCSSIEVNGEVHEFLAGGMLHAMDLDIRNMLQMVEAQMQPR